MNQVSVAVVGARGYVGSALCDALQKNSQIQLSRVMRENYKALRGGSYDVLINAAMPSKRFWAKSHPQEDFTETVQKTADLLSGWQFKKFVQISTLSVRTEPESVYGRHKAEAEALCRKGGHLIIRLGAMYSENLSKGALIDILQGARVYVSGESRYCFAPLEFVASWISRNYERRGLVEVGAKNSVSLLEIARHLGKKIEFEGPAECQEVLHPEPDFPDAKGVFQFMDRLKART